eukprot:s313_g4.t1
MNLAWGDFPQLFSAYLRLCPPRLLRCRVVPCGVGCSSLGSLHVVALLVMSRRRAGRVTLNRGMNLKIKMILPTLVENVWILKMTLFVRMPVKTWTRMWEVRRDDFFGALIRRTGNWEDYAFFYKFMEYLKKLRLRSGLILHGVILRRKNRTMILNYLKVEKHLLLKHRCMNLNYLEKIFEGAHKNLENLDYLEKRKEPLYHYMIVMVSKAFILLVRELLGDGRELRRGQPRLPLASVLGDGRDLRRGQRAERGRRAEYEPGSTQGENNDAGMPQHGGDQVPHSDEGGLREEEENGTPDTASTGAIGIEFGYMYGGSWISVNDLVDWLFQVGGGMDGEWPSIKDLVQRAASKYAEYIGEPGVMMDKETAITKERRTHRLLPQGVRMEWSADGVNGEKVEIAGINLLVNYDLLDELNMTPTFEEWKRGEWRPAWLRAYQREKEERERARTNAPIPEVPEGDDEDEEEED